MNIEQVLSSACPKLDIDKNSRLLFFHFKFLRSGRVGFRPTRFIVSLIGLFGSQLNLMKRFISYAVCLVWVGCGQPSVSPLARASSGQTNGSPADVAAVAKTNGVSPKIDLAIPVLPLPVLEVIQLVRRGVGEAVVTDFIERISEAYSLSSDQILYLNDLGIPEPVLRSLIQKSSVTSTSAVAIQTVIVQADSSAALNQPTSAVNAAQSSEKNVILNPYLTSTTGGGDAVGQIPRTSSPEQSSVGKSPEAPASVAPLPVQPVVVNQQVFNEALSPYGTWVEVPIYGRCWQPTVAVINSTWIPYSDGGRWAWTDSGWYWHSTYTWGWGPYHYGRWHRHNHHGWLWSPGYDWAPAWVAWRSNNDYCGWAPLPPECRWSSGVGFSWFNGHTSVSVGFGISPYAWYATPWNRFCHPRLHHVGLPRHNVGQFVNDSRITVGSGTVVNVKGNNNTVVINNGISREEVQRHTREEIRRTEIRDVASPSAAQSFGAARPTPSASRNPQLAAYRPTVSSQSPVAPPIAMDQRISPRLSPAVTRSPSTSLSGLSSRPVASPSINSVNSLDNTRSLLPSPAGAAPKISSRPAPITGLSATRGVSPGSVVLPSASAPNRGTAAPQFNQMRSEISRPSSPNTFPSRSANSDVRTVPPPAAQSSIQMAPRYGTFRSSSESLPRSSSPQASSPSFPSSVSRPTGSSGPAPSSSFAPSRPISSSSPNVSPSPSRPQSASPPRSFSPSPSSFQNSGAPAKSEPASRPERVRP